MIGNREEGCYCAGNTLVILQMYSVGKGDDSDTECLGGRQIARDEITPGFLNLLIVLTVLLR